MAGHGDPHYEYLTQLKDELLASNTLDADELGEEPPDPDEVERETKLEIAQRMRENGATAQKVAQDLDMSESWVHKYTVLPPTQ
jgi:predicted transposase YdaD